MGMMAANLRRVRGALIVLILVLASLTVASGSAQAAVSTRTVTGGDINQFCVGQGFEKAQLVASNAYGWRCAKGATQQGINLDALCSQFAVDAIARLADFNNPNSGWECWLTRTTVIATVTKANFDHFCQRFGYRGAVLISSDAYGWRCDSPNRQDGFSVTQLCGLLFQSGAVDRIGNFYDPYSWTCRVTVAPATLKINFVSTYQEGVLVFFRLHFDEGSAVGFGFRGANGAGWGEESHLFTSPSYGRYSPGQIDYPFNHACGTPDQYESDVEAWIFDGAGKRSESVIIHLACNGAVVPPPNPGPGGGTPQPSPGGPPGGFVCLGPTPENCSV